MNAFAQQNKGKPPLTSNGVTYTVIAILLAGVLIGGAIVLASGPSEPAGTAQNVSVQDGTQIIDITAKGAYLPKLSLAKANMPTVLRVTTRGTYDCSAALTIRAIGYSAMLPPSGVTQIEIPPQKRGSVITGSCAMGMYTFQVQFN